MGIEVQEVWLIIFNLHLFLPTSIFQPKKEEKTKEDEEEEDDDDDFDLFGSDEVSLLHNKFSCLFSVAQEDSEAAEKRKAQAIAAYKAKKEKSMMV